MCKVRILDPIREIFIIPPLALYTGDLKRTQQRVHLNRIARSDRYHCDPRSHALPRAGKGIGQSEADSVCIEPPANWARNYDVW